MSIIKEFFFNIKAIFLKYIIFEINFYHYLVIKKHFSKKTNKNFSN